MVSRYQVPARCDDLDRHPNRVPSIRQQMREDIDLSRSETRLMYRSKLRGIAMHSYQESIEDEPCGYDEIDSFPDSSDSGPYVTSDADPWMQTCSDLPSTPPPSNPPSPSPSTYSDISNGWYSHSLTCTPEHKPRVRSGQARSRKEILQHRKRVYKSAYNSEDVKQRYLTLKMQVAKYAHDSVALTRIVCASTNVLADALNDQDDALVRDSVILLTELVAHKYIPVTGMLFLLQQGLILHLKMSMSRYGADPTDVIAFLYNLILTEPRATPYLIELMRDTGIMDQMEQFLAIGSDMEITLVMRFYHHLIHILCELLEMGTFVPVVPENLNLTTQSSAKLQELYNPKSALERVVSPQLIYHVINRFFTHIGVNGEDSTRYAVSLCTFTLRLVQAKMNLVSLDGNWAREVLASFNEWNLNHIIVKHLESPCSGTVLKRDMRNFLELYQDMNISVTKLTT